MAGLLNRQQTSVVPSLIASHHVHAEARQIEWWLAGLLWMHIGACIQQECVGRLGLALVHQSVIQACSYSYARLHFDSVKQSGCHDIEWQACIADS